MKAAESWPWPSSRQVVWQHRENPQLLPLDCGRRAWLCTAVQPVSWWSFSLAVRSESFFLFLFKPKAF